MAGARAPTTRCGSVRFAPGYIATESSRRPAVECVLAHNGPGRRPIEVSERNFFAELKRRNVYSCRCVRVVAWLLIQAASIFFPAFDAPPWVMKIFIIVIIFEAFRCR